MLLGIALLQDPTAVRVLIAATGLGEVANILAKKHSLVRRAHRIQGYLTPPKTPIPWDSPRTLGTGLR